MPSHRQLALQLGQVDPPEHLLRAAWEQSRLQQSFEEAMQLQHFRIGLRHMAMSMAGQGKRRKKR